MLRHSYITIALFVLTSGILFAQPAAPQLQSPRDGATDQPTTITFEWSAVDGADRYQIQVSEEDPNFSGSSIVYSDITTSTSITLSGFSHSTTYYWRVRAGEDNPLLGTTTYGDWSEIWNLITVEAPPPAPALVSPNDGATEVSTSPLLKWEQADRADTYQLQVDQTSNFSSPVVDQTGITATEEQVSGLQFTTTYYWRVRATNKGGTSNWSEVWSFTTAEAPPPPVRLTAPDSGATGITTTPRLDWEPADRAETYDFQVATDNNFNQKVVSLNNVTSTHYDAELEGYTTYYWRVRGENDTAPGEWSSVWNFTTERTGNAISIKTPSGGDLWKAGEKATIRWQTTNNVKNVKIEYRPVPDKPWIQIVDSIDANSGVYAWKVPDVSSTQAIIKISDSGSPDINAISKPFMLYPASLQLKQSYSFNSAAATSDYQLVGLPGQIKIPVDKVTSGEPGEDWKAYFDNGSQENYLVEFDGSERFTLKPGGALFVISKNKAEISEHVPSVQLADDTTFAIPLHKGWNMIANPFDIPISWKKVQTKNNLSASLWTFEGDYKEATRFEPYNGYYFFNRDSLDKLVIPYDPFDPSVYSKSNAETGTQRLTLKLISSDGTETSSIQVGFDSSLKGKDRSRYQFAPPGDFQNYKLTIESGQFTGRQAHIARLFHAPPESKRSFSLRVKSRSKGPVKIKAEGLEEFDRYEILLVDRQTSKNYDLRSDDKIILNPDQIISDYTLIIGNAKEVETAKEHITPTTFHLSQNYPNPFNGQTVIAYSIPEGTSDTPVKLEIFDVLGRKVATLVNKRQPPGRYEARWNAQNNRGKLLSSGTYFYRLSIGDNVKTKQLTLIK